MPKANIIHLHAAPTQAASLGALLESGGALVDQTEPRTLRWHALCREGHDSELAIFDVFPDQAGRQAHFDGQVAAALHGRAGELVAGGWEQVLANISNMVVLAEHQADTTERAATKAGFIQMTARPDQVAALRALLTAGRDVVAQTEPGTVYWAALESEDRAGEFAIFDLFVDDAARDAHFAGRVAAALEERASTLIEGGWEQGVLANVMPFEVRASVTRS
ncbi:MAG: hypothetical protein KDK70_33840 [Myxococcales bacterium]|nr:hypothetical protein [Myxococcales bacterium]